MNQIERQMRDILQEGKDSFGVVSVKAEFEAEGTRMDELLRLVDIARAAGLPLTVKIGGCEAIRDLFEAKQIGVRYIVAPMVETTYALEKFISAKNLVFDEDEQQDTHFLFNMETITAFEQRLPMIRIGAKPQGANGLVFGRVDFLGSMGRGRNDINNDDITRRIVEVGSLLKENNLDLVVGGGVSIDTLETLRTIASSYLTRFETRKVVFTGEAVTLPDIERGLLNAVHFELLWLMNKRDYYGRITREDSRRIEMLESRWRVLSDPPS
jgi:hypothetical protein